MSPTTTMEREQHPMTAEQQPTSHPITKFCLNCGAEIAEQPAHLELSGGLIRNCPICDSSKGRTDVSPEQFGDQLRLRGKLYLELAGVKYLQME